MRLLVRERENAGGGACRASPAGEPCLFFAFCRVRMAPRTSRAWFLRFVAPEWRHSLFFCHLGACVGSFRRDRFAYAQVRGLPSGRRRRGVGWAAHFLRQSAKIRREDLLRQFCGDKAQKSGSPRGLWGGGWKGRGPGGRVRPRALTAWTCNTHGRLGGPRWRPAWASRMGGPRWRLAWTARAGAPKADRRPHGQKGGRFYEFPASMDFGSGGLSQKRRSAT